MTQPSVQIVGIGVDQLIKESKRLGLTWTLIPATVAPVTGAVQSWPVSNTFVIQDNDVEISRAISLIGRLPSFTRVMVMHVPPQGNYIIGFLSDLYGGLNLPLGIPADPMETASNGTTTSGGVETRDAVLGDYVFTALPNRLYRAVLDNGRLNASVAGATYDYTIRDGGDTTPTAASTEIARGRIVLTIAGGGGQETTPIARPFPTPPTEGIHTLSMFYQLVAGAGVGTPVGNRALYVMDLGPSPKIA